MSESGNTITTYSDKINNRSVAVPADTGKSSSLANFTGSVRILQVALSVIMLGLSAKLTANQSSLSSLTNSVNSLVKDSGLGDIVGSLESTSSLQYSSQAISLSSLSNYISPSILSIVTSSFTATSHSLFSTIFPRVNDNIQADITSITSAIRTFAQRAYVSGLTTSEISSLGLWFASFSYQTARYGNWNCENVDHLLAQYNISSHTTADHLTGVLGVDGLSLSNLTDIVNENSTLYNEYSGLFDLLDNLTTADPFVTNWNESSTIQKQQLLVKISHDCLLKKANIGVSFLGLFSFLLSGGSVLTSAVSLKQAVASNRVDIEKGEANHPGNNNQVTIIRKPNSVASTENYKTVSETATSKLTYRGNESAEFVDGKYFEVPSNGPEGTYKAKFEIGDFGVLTTSAEVIKVADAEAKNDEPEPLLPIPKRRLQFSHAILFPSIIPVE